MTSGWSTSKFGVWILRLRLPALLGGTLSGVFSEAMENPFVSADAAFTTQVCVPVLASGRVTVATVPPETENPASVEFAQHLAGSYSMSVTWTVNELEFDGAAGGAASGDPRTPGSARCKKTSEAAITTMTATATQMGRYRVPRVERELRRRGGGATADGGEGPEIPAGWLVGGGGGTRGRWHRSQYRVPSTFDVPQLGHIQRADSDQAIVRSPGGTRRH
jgi:hypothetical protein